MIIYISYVLTLVSFVSIVLIAIQGYYFNVDTLSKEEFVAYLGSHISYAFASIIIYTLTQTIIMFYFIGSGKKIKETILQYNLDKAPYQKVLKIKRKLFPHLTMNILLIGTAFIVGGAAHTIKDFNIWWHSGLFIIGILHYVKVIFMQNDAFRIDREILIDIGGQVDKQMKGK